MNEQQAIRYALAHVISHSHMDMGQLDEQTLMDVFSILPEPRVSFATWLERQQPPQTAEDANEEALSKIKLLYGKAS